MVPRFSPFKRLVLASLCCCIAAPAAFAATTATTTVAVTTAAARTHLQATVDGAIRPVMAKYGVPGIAVAVTVDGQVLFFNYGVASKASGAPVNEDTLFELGSISKTLTATLACYAQGQGKLSFDEHPSRYMPQLKGSAIDAASVLDLGTYAAGGLPLQFPDQVEDSAQILAYFRGWKPDAAPGMLRQYSNPSLGLFGHLAGLALKTDFASAIEQQLLPALGMEHSYVQVPGSAVKQYAWGYDSAGKPVRVTPGALDTETYGIKSTAADMIHFLQVNINPGTLAAPFQRAVECTHVGYLQVSPAQQLGDMVQGLGWEQYRGNVSLQRLLDGNSEKMIFDPNPVSRLTPPQPAPTGTLFNKTGSTRGFGAYAIFKPEQKIGIVILANKNYPIPARVTAAYAILQQLEQGAKAAAAR